MESIADAIAAFISQQDLHGCILVGYSLGARLALAVAARHPGLLQGVVSISGTAGIKGVQQRQERAAADDAAARLLEANGSRDFVRDWYHKPMWDSLRHHPRWATHC